MRHQQKTCKTCGETSSLSNFYHHLGVPRLHCKSCQREKARVSYKEKGKTIPLYRELLNNAHSRSKKKDVEFSLTEQWLRPRLEAGICEVTGMAFGDRKSPTTPSLDRTDPTKGYTPDNVKVTVWIYNRCKGVHSHEDVMAMVTALSGCIH